jgi:hypothetical protein
MAGTSGRTAARPTVRSIVTRSVTHSVGVKAASRNRVLGFYATGVYSMSGISTLRLYLLRAGYLYIAVGLATFELPALLHPENLSRLDAVVLSMLGAFALLTVLGIRYPLKMLPLLFFEFVWKSIWVVAFGLPLLLSGRLGPETTETLTACLMGVVLVPLVTPWGYVLKHYLRAPGDRWGTRVISRTPKNRQLRAENER